MRALATLLATSLIAIPLTTAGVAGQAAGAAATGDGAVEAAVRDELMAHFDVSMRKFIALANAMPADRYTWSPGEGVMEVGRVYMHVARYNYMYPSGSLGAALPEGVTLDGMEAERDKETVVRALEASRDWVKSHVAGMAAQDLAATTELYGRQVPGWAVLVQLVSHMNEHLGQSIAYARMNEIVPPWSR
jgi:uncharacterized damage-inducible protein DinB